MFRDIPHIIPTVDTMGEMIQMSNGLISEVNKPDISVLLDVKSLHLIPSNKLLNLFKNFRFV